MKTKIATQMGIMTICAATAYMAYTTNTPSAKETSVNTASLSHPGGDQKAKNLQTSGLTNTQKTRAFTEDTQALAGQKPQDPKAADLTSALPQQASVNRELPDQKEALHKSEPVTSEHIKSETAKPADVAKLEASEKIVAPEESALTENKSLEKKQQSEQPSVKLALAKPEQLPAASEKVLADTKTPEAVQFQNNEQTPEQLKALLDNALKPLIDLPLEAKDKEHLTDALKLAKKGKTEDALAIAKKVSQPAAQKLVRWQIYKNDPHSYSLKDLKEFLTQNNDWPAQDNLQIAAESHIVRASESDQKKHFAVHPPITSVGQIAQAGLLMKEGKEEEAIKIIQNVWHEKESAAAESVILEKYKKYLTQKDIKMKADYYLYKKQIASSQKIAKHLDEKGRKKVEARISILQKPKNLAKIVDGLSAEDKLDPGILFERIKYARQKENYEQAWELFKKVPNDPVLLGHAEAWWPERERSFREAFERKNYVMAYELAKNHGQTSANQINEAEFLAGWIAYRFLKKPDQGYKHFEKLAQSVDGPISKSKAYYWLGRTALDLGQTEKAEQHFKEGAPFFNTFYGQLARQSLTPKDNTLVLPPMPVPTAQDITTFQNREVIKALVLSHKAGLEGFPTSFFSHLKDELKSPGEVILLADLAMRLGYHQQAVRIGKAAMARGINAVDYSYPVGLLPEFKALRKLPESAFYYGITRQETEFNPTIISSAGAKGMMQVMPITAKHVATQHKIKYEPERLLKDVPYNVMIGTAYIADRMDEYDGSYIKAIAGFNAGPGRVREWVKTFGDPSNAKVDPIDWIEGIPFDETRGYVVKVLSNIQMYRARLGTPQTALQIRQDIYRDRDDADLASKPLLASN